MIKIYFPYGYWKIIYIFKNRFSIRMFEIEGINILKHLGGIWNMHVQSVVPNRTFSNNKGMYYNCVFQYSTH